MSISGRLKFISKDIFDRATAGLITAILYLLKKLPPNRSTALAERIAKRVGFWFPRTKLARKNLKLAFPEKSVAEIEEILTEMWGNIGRLVAEYVFLDQLFDFDINNPDAGRIEGVGVENYKKRIEDRRPAIFFTAHTGNWELLPIAGAAYGLNTTALFRPPNNKYIAKRVLEARTTSMGHLVPSKAGAAWALAGVLENGGCVGVLVDQHFTRGPEIEFFGRPAKANPLLAKLARQYDCAVHPCRSIRLPNGRFRLVLEDELDMPRDEHGEIDIEASTAMVNQIVEGWVREYPGQWLWLHDRWKMTKRKR